MTTWQGLDAEEIASIPRDEYCFQKIERILRERNELRELSDEEIEEIYFKDFNYEGEDFIEFAKAVLRKAQQK
jgi:hypothetical protein